jgi:hypothetical protein
MPAKDRLGRDEERRPPSGRHERRQGGDERPVREEEARTANLTAEDGELLAEQEDLGLLVDRVHSADPDEFTHATDQAEEEAERQGAGASSGRSCLVKPAIE